jgi:hypothetical protein
LRRDRRWQESTEPAATGDWVCTIARAGRRPEEARCRPGPDRLRAQPCRYALATVLMASLPAFDRFLRRGPTSRPTPGPLDQRQALGPATGASTSGRRSVSDRSLRQGRQGDTVEAIAPDAQRSDRGMLQGGWTAVRLGRYLSVTAVAVVYVGRAQVAARCAGGPPRVRLPTVVFPSLRDASPHFCLCFCRCAGVPPPFVWISLDSLVRIETYQWVTRWKTAENFFARLFP